MTEETSNYEKMRGFVMALLDEFYPECADIDGGTFQDLAEKYGLLIPEIRHEPCGEFCACNENVYDEEWQDGVTCYHAAEWLRAVEHTHALDECQGHAWNASHTGFKFCPDCGNPLSTRR